MITLCKHLTRLALVAFVPMSAACGSAPKPAPPPPEPIVEAPEEEEEPLPHIDGDAQVPERFAKAFGEWLRAENAGGAFTRVITVSEVSNAVTVVVERHLEMGGECRIGPSAIELTLEDDGDITSEATHFGEDCCPGTQCEMTPDSWNLRYIHAVDAEDDQALSLLFPAKKKVKYKLATPEGTTKEAWSRKDIAAGKFAAPGCGFVDTRPSCGEPDPKTGAFTCRCDGGGTHTELNWQKEGDGFVIVSIDESSS